eukprot:TRINITY_DN12502_c0_g1_i1.p1 TRINITY_DN12502_c0_g1~~TRINITY_DN12502_c0_g1_i1.p1  ORF type:complete len:898 (+),score=349.73 TRINITY_DN12502_c0_g1_i1:45-2696(+)
MSSKDKKVRRKKHKKAKVSKKQEFSDEWIIDSILDARLRDEEKETVEYLISWKGFSEEENVWQTEEELKYGNVDFKSAVDAYNEAHEASEDELSSEEELDPALVTLRPEAQVLTELKKTSEVGVSPDVWLKERKALLMVLEARMLLREMVDYKMRILRERFGLLSPAEIKRLLGLYGDDDDRDFIADLQELRRKLVEEIHNKHNLEKDLANLELKISLLILNRTSIHELDRVAQKQKKKKAEAEITQIKSLDRKQTSLYSNLFYLLQTEPKYLARLAYLVDLKKMDEFIETLLLTLYGEAFSQREEFLLLTLFQLAIENEISHLQSPMDLKQVDSVVPKMILTYNKRKQGKEYLTKALNNPITHVLEHDEYDFELDPELIFGSMQSQSPRGGKSKVVGDIADNPEVKKRTEKTLAQLKHVLQLFIDALMATINEVPYGLRYICSQIYKLLTRKFPKVKEDQLWKVIGFYVYFKFLNPAIANPADANIGTGGAISMKTTTNLLQVGKILQALFDLRVFPAGNPRSLLNNWLKKKRVDIVETYFAQLINVGSPEDYLRKDRYTELYSKTKPIIIIRLREIFVTHNLVREFIDDIAKEDDDPLRIIIEELGDEKLPVISKENSAEAQLILESRFSGASVEKELDKNAELFDATKELVIQIFKAAPVEEATEPNLVAVFKLVKEWSKDQGNQTVAKQLSKAQDNLDVLEKAGMVSRSDNYDTFLRAVALEVTNRTERREALRKEIAKLRATIKELQNHAKYLQNQISDFDAYLKSVREQAMANFLKGKKKKQKPLKFSYKDLQKRGIILDSEVPPLSRGRTKFYISMKALGKFHIEAKIANVSVGKMEIELEDLLEKKENRDNKLELEQVTLNVPQTVLLLNKYFLK